MKCIFIVVFCMAMLSLFMTGCNDESIRPSNNQIAQPDSIQPDQITYGAHIYLYNAGHKTTDLTADEISKFSSLDSTIATNLYVDFFDSIGQRISTLTANRGYIRENDNFLAVNGSVVLIGHDSVTLWTEYLEWDGQIDSIVTDSFVTIIRPGGDTLISKEGIKSDPQLKNISFKSASGRLTVMEKAKDENK